MLNRKEEEPRNPLNVVEQGGEASLGFNLSLMTELLKMVLPGSYRSIIVKLVKDVLSWALAGLLLELMTERRYCLPAYSTH